MRELSLDEMDKVTGGTGQINYPAVNQQPLVSSDGRPDDLLSDQIKNSFVSAGYMKNHKPEDWPQK